MMPVTRDQLRGKAQTVLGIVDPGVLGSTLTHEHLIWDIRPPAQRTGDQGAEPDLGNHWGMATGLRASPANAWQPSVEVAIEAVAEAVAHGCQTIVEMSIGGLSPDPEGLVKVSEATGCHIVMGCGHYVEEYQDPRNHTRTVDDFAAEMVAQVQEGLWGTRVRAGIIGEIGCQNPWTPLERRVMEAALIAQKETGAALTIHPGRRQDQPQEVMEFIKARGGDPSRTIMDHIDRTIFDDDALFRLADTGVVLEWDLFGQESCMYTPNLDVDMPNDAGRLRAIRKVLDRGHRGQVVIAHDICHRAHMSRWGGWGYAHIHRDVLPLMRRRGFTEAEISEILVETPRRLLTFV
jgi:phosphotriesterase-related protein